VAHIINKYLITCTLHLPCFNSLKI
jgi:hypothetical protein